MNTNHILKIASEFDFDESRVQAVATLLEQDSTIPFIARYRKEATGSLDEVQITGIRDRLKQLEELDTRKDAVLKSLEHHGHLTNDLKETVLAAQTMAVLEDIYLPYKPKRRTRATVAREKGLEILARILFEQKGIDPLEAARPFLNQEKGVHAIDDALSGARDIMAEMISEDPKARAMLRDLFVKNGSIISRVASEKEIEGSKYKDYFHWEEPATKAPSHRILAMRRGEKEDILNLSFTPPEGDAIQILETLFMKGNGQDSIQVHMSIRDSYKRLLSRSMETELRLITKERADSEAIRVFAENLRQLLLAPPLGPKRVMGIDPGFRTGCKIVCLDRQGQLIHYDTIYPHSSEKTCRKACEQVLSLCDRFNIETIAIGNGTAGRETESFIKNLPLSGDIHVFMVNESGASVYSASVVAREEFPDCDLTVRGAVSIGRRLIDPLAELVKIDPKSIGVGQYQHDVDQTALKERLDDVVISCVNRVGVDLNTASIQLLTYVSGLGLQLAKNIVAHRNENGAFRSREDLLAVPRLGPKAFEQSAGFLRIRNGENPLDASAVHPESYPIVYAMANDLGCSVSDLLNSAEFRQKIDVSKYLTDKIGIPTLNDIINELAKPGRDPREDFEAFSFTDGISGIENIRPGMKLTGVVTNVTAFGAFVDIGIHHNGLIHISELSDRYVKDPSGIIKVHQKVTLTVIGVDLERNRISLSMKSIPDAVGQKPKSSPEKKAKAKVRPFNNPFAEKFEIMKDNERSGR
ncbi:MAG TPA: Tex family protein [Desulfobacterales bacterium]|nr:Tex family protein [Desulfobacterales bacterium]